MPNAEEITIIEGLRSGGTERRRFENILWQRFSGFIYWGMNKYHLSKDEAQQAYDDAICSVIINIVNGRYLQDAGALLKTYAETIFHHKCVDHLNQAKKNVNTNNIEKRNFNNPQPITESLVDVLPGEVKNAVEGIIEREDWMKMKHCLEKIGELCKEILLLFGGGYKDKEIAEIMKYNSSDVAKQTRYRCLEKLSQNYFAMQTYE